MNTPSQAAPAGHPARETGCFPMIAVGVAVLAVLFLAVFGGVLLLRPFWSDFLHRPQEQRHEHRAVGRKLPRLELQPLSADGKQLTLADIEGRVVLLDFWGTWCPPCREEIPHIADLQRRFGANPAFRLLAVSCGQAVQEDMPGLRSSTKRFLERQGLHLPTYADPDCVTRNAVDDVAGFEGYPTTLILDRQGVIRGVWVGYQPGFETEMEDLLDRLLSNP